MLSVGLHCRLVGRPGRAASLARFVDYVLEPRPRMVRRPGSTSRATGSRKHPPPGGWKPSRLTRTLFVERFGGVYEHSPWVAAAAYDAGLTAEADSAGRARQGDGGAPRRADRDDAEAGADPRPPRSRRQARARQDADGGVDAGAGERRPRPARRPDELARFTALNDAYAARFGFPFIMAVKGRSKAEILAAFEARLVQRSGGRDGDGAGRDRPHRGAARLKDILP